MKDSHEEVLEAALKNYSASTPWPTNDVWHSFTFSAEKAIIENWLSVYANKDAIILNAGSGGTEYLAPGKWIHMDIIESYVSRFHDYIVGSIERIPLQDASIDGIVCVGSVLNYADAQRAIGEFARILKPGGFLILEFERTNSAEFLFTSEHGKYIFMKDYFYNNQTHHLWMYSEKHIRLLLKNCKFKILQCRRVHSLSSLLNRFGMSEENSAPYLKYDLLLQPISYPIAHNVILFARKDVLIHRSN